MAYNSLSPVAPLIENDTSKYTMGKFVPPSTPVLWSIILETTMAACNRKRDFAAAGHNVITGRIDSTVVVAEKTCVIVVDKQPLELLITPNGVHIDMHETWCDMFWHRHRYHITLQFAGKAVAYQNSCRVQCKLPLLHVTIAHAKPICIEWARNDSHTLRTVSRQSHINEHTQVWVAKLNATFVALARFERRHGWHCKTCAKTFETLNELAQHMSCTSTFYKMSADGTLHNDTPPAVHLFNGKTYTWPVCPNALQSRLRRLV